MSKKVKISRTQVIAMHDFMKDIMSKDADGFVSYKDGWSDAKVASHFGVTESGVQGLRSELFGLIARKKISEKEEQAERIAALENAYAGLLEKFAKLCEKHKKLCENLSVNRILDVRHLAGID